MFKVKVKSSQMRTDTWMRHDKSLLYMINIHHPDKLPSHISNLFSIMQYNGLYMDLHLRDPCSNPLDYNNMMKEVFFLHVSAVSICLDGQSSGPKNSFGCCSNGILLILNRFLLTGYNLKSNFNF